MPSKTSGEPLDDGSRFHEPSATRPLSVVDSSNRIIAAAFKVALERKANLWVSSNQRGFLAGRQMMRNLMDIDFAAHKISVLSNTGAILLLDFRAAFPSMSHEINGNRGVGICGEHNNN